MFGPEHYYEGKLFGQFSHGMLKLLHSNGQELLLPNDLTYDRVSSLFCCMFSYNMQQNLGELTRLHPFDGGTTSKMGCY